MKHLLFFIISLIICSIEVNAQYKILIVTGGHDFEKQAFFEMFNSFSSIEYKWVEQPEGNKLIESGELGDYQAIVYYDMYQEITKAQQKAFIAKLKEGIGIVFLHHSLVSYQEWPEFQQIIGGKYLQEGTSGYPRSTYKHDVNFQINIASEGINNPVTKGINDFMIHDEVYGHYIVNDNVTPLLITNHPESSEVICWVHTYHKSKIVYIQPGHDHHAYENPNYRQLVLQAIEFVASE